MSNRHRRTRIYGANYDLGESYYKKQLNDLDNRKSVSRSHDSPFEMDNKKESKLSPKVTFLSEDLDFNDTSTNLRKINVHDLKDESSTQQRNFRKLASNDFVCDEEYDKNPPKAAREFSTEYDRFHKQFGKNSNRFFGRDEADFINLPLNLEEKAISHVTLRSKIIGGNSIRNENIMEEDDALRRANASKARLLDLEEQITSITSKQNEREKRNQNLKKILSEVTSTNELV